MQNRARWQRWATLPCRGWAQNWAQCYGVNPSVETILDWHTCRYSDRGCSGGQLRARLRGRFPRTPHTRGAHDRPVGSGTRSAADLGGWRSLSCPGEAGLGALKATPIACTAACLVSMLPRSVFAPVKSEAKRAGRMERLEKTAHAAARSCCRRGPVFLRRYAASAGPLSSRPLWPGIAPVQSSYEHRH